MKLDNHIIPFQLGGNKVRGSIVRLGSAVSEIIKRNNYPKNIESLLADTLTITACLGSRMKHDGVFTIQAKGTGEVHTLFSDLNLPQANIIFPENYSESSDDLKIFQAMKEFSPGRVSRRYGIDYATQKLWIGPIDFSIIENSSS